MSDHVTVEGASQPPPSRNTAPRHDTISATSWSPPKVYGNQRQRLANRLEAVWHHPVTLVIAPAGFGKTTAVAMWAAATQHPVNWVESHQHQMCSEIRDELIAISRPGQPVAIVIDDFHLLEEAALAAFCQETSNNQQTQVRLVLIGRHQPRFSLSKQRLAGDVLEISGGDLRFRAAEAEELFTNDHAVPLEAADVARLNRDLGGWPAGLRLYQLAAQSRTPKEQRRLLGMGALRSRIGQEYLATNVIGGLDQELKAFLFDTCMLGTMTPELCDQLRQRDDSTSLLNELSRRQLFVSRSGDGQLFHYHDVLRGHLESVLVEHEAPERLNARFHQAGELLAAHGQRSDAQRCFARAGSWDRLYDLCQQPADGRLSNAYQWLSVVPESLVENDPWLLITRARAGLADGRFSQAERDYRAAGAKMVGAGQAMACQREHRNVFGLIDPNESPHDPILQSFRSGMRSDALPRAYELIDSGEARGILAGAVLLLVLGRIPEALRTLRRVELDADASNWIAASACTARAIASLLSAGQQDPAVIDRAEYVSHASGFGWLTRLARACAALTSAPNGPNEAAKVVDLCDRDGDAWGAVLARTFQCLGLLSRGAAAEAELEDAHRRCAALQCNVLGLMVRSCLAISHARSGKMETAATMARMCQHEAVSSGNLAALGMAMVALRAVDDPHEPDAERCTELVTDGAFRVPRPDGSPGILSVAILASRPVSNELLSGSPTPVAQTNSASDRPSTGPEPQTTGVDVDPSVLGPFVKCLGQFVLIDDGTELDLSSLRPRPRLVLKFLALSAGQQVHRDILIDLLWPDALPGSALRSLQVAVSSVRRCLRDTSFSLAREAETYGLVANDTIVTDLQTEDALVSSVHASSDAQEIVDAGIALQRLHAERLLEDEGALDWLVRERNHRELRAAEALARSTSHALEIGRADLAQLMAERGLELDQWSDPLCRLLIQACEVLGDLHSTRRARDRYRRVLEELGVDTEPTAGQG